MAGIDKAAIGFTIAIVAIGVALAGFGSMSQDNPPPVSIPTAPIVPAEKMEAENMEAEKMEAENMEAEKMEAEKLKAEKMEAEKLKAEKMEAEKLKAEKMEAEKLKAEKMEAEKLKAEKMEAEKLKAEKMEASGPQTVSVDIPSGTAVPGCEETDECYLPPSVSINTGDTVEWTNSDTAAHTVTGGSPADGPSGVFDSSLVLGGAQYAFTFEQTGSYDYFCMVHPWMVGSVQVN